MFTSLRRHIALAAAILLLGACSQERLDVETPKQLRVSRVSLEHRLAFAPGASGLDAAESGRLNRFLQRELVGYGDQVTIVVPESMLANEALLDGRRAAVMRELARSGLSVAGAFVGEGSVDGKDEMRLVVLRHVVTTPPCPSWERGVFESFDNMVASNFGCATMTNLGLMVANPGDLLRGRDPGAADGEASVLAIQRYREGKITPLKELDGTFGGGGKK
ncbi:MAG: hypothetical protein KIT20_12140 [Alphaproteobacteria bacterium]|nr:hypothetical protein [Alphaproteobacteria bacterium]